MSSDPFDLLELDRATATDADVRRAYAAKLKVTRPEDDRAGFMALRAAFEQARRQVRWRAGYEDHDQDHSPPDEHDPSRAQSAAGDGNAAQAPPPGLCEADTGITRAPQEAVIEPERATNPRLPGPGARTGPEAGPEAGPEPGPEAGPEPGPRPGPEPDEADADAAQVRFEDRIGAAMDRLVDMLTATGRAPEVGEVMAVIDEADVAGIEEYQWLQAQVRDFLCDRTGYNLAPQALHIPDWLTLEVFDALDQYYGWTRQPGTQVRARRLNDWMARVRREAALGEMPPGARRRAEAKERRAASEQDKGSQVWLWIGAAILISQIIRFFIPGGGG